jgi:hypothetical protein
VRSTLCTALLFAFGAARALAGAPQERVRQTVDAVSAVLNNPELQASSKERDRRDRVAKVMHESTSGQWREIPSDRTGRASRG